MNLRETLSPWIGPEVTDESEALFEQHQQARMVPTLCLILTAALFGLLAWWPLDHWIFAGDAATLAALDRWRLTMVAIQALALLAVWRVPLVRASPWLTIAVVSSTSAAVTGALLADAGAPFFPFFQFAFLLAAPAMTFPWPLPKRLALGLLTLAAWVVGAAWGTNALVDSPMTRNTLGMAAFAILGIAMDRQVYYRLQRLNFVQKLALDRRAHELQALDRLKSQFFANVSHELRTPLTLTLGSLQSLAEPVDAETRRREVSIGLRATNRLLSLVDELLELARFDDGRTRAQPRVIDLAALLQEAASDFGAGPAEASIRTTGLDAPVLCVADPRQLRKVADNLLGNAMKFTRPEDRRITLALDEGGATVSFSVTDNGIGLDASEHARVFDRFMQVDGSTTRRHEGVGIGLSLVKEIVEHHDGRIDIASSLGHGATFTVTLPIGDVSAGPTPFAPLPSSFADALPVPEELPPARDDGPLVLVAEDNVDLRARLGRLLGAEYRVMLAADGEEALALARQTTPDLILTDAMMPRLSGTELLSEVRADAALAEVPVILITARAGSGSSADAVEAGADDYLTKPFDVRELRARVASQLDRRLRALELRRLNDELEDRVLAQTAELRELAGHLADVLETERARVARDLHDELGQVLVGLRLEVSGLRSRLSEPAHLAPLRRLDALVDAMLTSVQSILRQLRPRVLDEAGLVASLEWLTEDFEQRTGVDCELRVGPGVQEASDQGGEREVAVFRIVQECLTNVAKHAEATRVSVSLALVDAALQVTVHDDGKGLGDEVRPRRSGLAGMRERARQFGGRLGIHSGDGGGTRVELSLPL